jgi:hypothetical protein
MPLVDDAVRVVDGGVVDENVDVIFRRQQGADVALEHEVRLHGALDGLPDLGVGGVRELAHLLADRLLPVREPPDVFVDPRIRAHAYTPCIVRANQRTRTPTRVASVGDNRSSVAWRAGCPSQ